MNNKLSKTKKEFDPLKHITEEILKLKQKTSENIISIGQYLCDVKQILNHGEFTKWLEEKVDFTPRTARKFMKVYEVFGDPEEGNAASVLNLSSEKMYLLTGLNKKDREQFIKDYDVEQISTRKLKQTIKDIKANAKTVKSNTQMLKQNNPMDTVPHGEESNPTDDIWKDTIELYDEIILRTGDFYYSDNLELDKKENLLLTRYIAKEITFDQLKETIITNKLNIPIIINEEEYKKYIDGLEIYNAYMHYVDLYGYDSKEDKSYTYYSILLTGELDYKDVVQKTYAIEQGETEETRQQWIRDDNYLLNKDNITIDLGYEDCSEYICIYINQKLFAHYDIKKTDYYKCIKKLFAHYGIDKKYLKLVDEFTKQREKDVMEQLQRTYDNNVKKARFKYIEGNETYLLLHCLDDTDYIKVFKDLKSVATYTFPTKINLYSLDFYTTVLTCDFVKDIIKQTESNADTRLEYIMKFKNKLVAKAREQYNSFKRQYENNFNWDGFGFDDFKTNTKKKDVSIDIFDSEELGFLKDMLDDKSLWRKFYVKTANKIHPDKVVSKGQEAINEAENQMKLLNAINDKIQKCC